MDGVGRATDNIATQKFWRTIKYEEIYFADNNLDAKGVKPLLLVIERGEIKLFDLVVLIFRGIMVK